MTAIQRLLIVCLTTALLGGAHHPRPLMATAASPEVRGAERFGIGVFTTPAWDFFVALTPDQRSAYFCRADVKFAHFTILETRSKAGKWDRPRVAPFSGRWSDADPHVTPDGSQLFFISNRPLEGARPRSDYDIWFVERRGGTAWSEPRHLGAPVSRDSVIEWSPSVAASRNLYFGMAARGGKGGNDLYVSRWADGAYSAPENLGDSINTRAGEVEPWISPDERYLVFSGQGRPGAVGGFDIYISHKANDRWGVPRLLLAGVNSEADDFNPSVSPDGRFLYFSSTRSSLDSIPRAPRSYDELQRRLLGVGNGLGDIYRVELRQADPQTAG